MDKQTKAVTKDLMALKGELLSESCFGAADIAQRGVDEIGRLDAELARWQGLVTDTLQRARNAEALAQRYKRTILESDICPDCAGRVGGHEPKPCGCGWKAKR